MSEPPFSTHPSGLFHTVDEADVDLLIFGDSWTWSIMGNGKTYADPDSGQPPVPVYFNAGELANPSVVGSGLWGQETLLQEIGGDGLLGVVLDNPVLTSLLLGPYLTAATRQIQLHHIMNFTNGVNLGMTTAGITSHYHLASQAQLIGEVGQGPEVEVPEGSLFLPEGLNGHRGFSVDGVLLERLKAVYGMDLNKINRYDFGIGGATIWDTITTSCLTCFIPFATDPDPLTPDVVPEPPGGSNQWRAQDIGQNMDPKVNSDPDDPESVALTGTDPRPYAREAELDWDASTIDLYDSGAIKRPPARHPAGHPTKPNERMEAWEIIQNPPSGKAVVLINASGNDMLAKLQGGHQSPGPGTINSIDFAGPAGTWRATLSLDLNPYLDPETERWSFTHSGIDELDRYVQGTNPNGNASFSVIPVTGTLNQVDLWPSNTVAGGPTGTLNPATLRWYRNDSDLLVPYSGIDTADDPEGAGRQYVGPPKFWDLDVLGDPNDAIEAQALKSFIDAHAFGLMWNPNDPNRATLSINGQSGALENGMMKIADWLHRLNPNVEICWPSYTNFSVDDPDWDGDTPGDQRGAYPVTARPKGNLTAPADNWLDARGNWHAPMTIPVNAISTGVSFVFTDDPSHTDHILPGDRYTLIDDGGSSQVRTVDSVPAAGYVVFTAAPTQAFGGANPRIELYGEGTWVTGGEAAPTGIGLSLQTTNQRMTALLDPEYQAPYVNPETIGHMMFFPAHWSEGAGGGAISNGWQGDISLPGWGKGWFAMLNHAGETVQTYGYLDFNRWQQHFQTDRDYYNPAGRNVTFLCLGDDYTGGYYIYNFNHPFDKAVLWQSRYPIDACGAFFSTSVGGTLVADGAYDSGTWLGHYYNSMNFFESTKFDMGVNPGTLLPYCGRFVIEATVNRVLQNTLVPAQMNQKTFWRDTNPHTGDPGYVAPATGRFRFHTPQCWHAHKEASAGVLWEPNPTLAALHTGKAPWDKTPLNPDGDNYQYQAGSRYNFVEGVHLSLRGTRGWVDSFITQWVPESDYMSQLIQQDATIQITDAPELEVEVGVAAAAELSNLEGWSPTGPVQTAVGQIWSMPTTLITQEAYGDVTLEYVSSDPRLTNIEINGVPMNNIGDSIQITVSTGGVYQQPIIITGSSTGPDSFVGTVLFRAYSENIPPAENIDILLANGEVTVTGSIIVAPEEVWYPCCEEPELGTAFYDVWIYERGGIVPFLHVNTFTELSWGRTLDEISAARVAFGFTGNRADRTGYRHENSDVGSDEDWNPYPIDDGCQMVSQINPWQHELVIFRNRCPVWVGPIQTVSVDMTNGRCVIDADDLFRWLDRRFIRCDLTLEEADTAFAFGSIFHQAMDLAPVGIDLELSPTGVKADRDYYFDEFRSAGEELREFGRNGIDFTMVNRRLLVGPENLDQPPVTSLNDSHFATQPTVFKSGIETGTRFVVGSGLDWSEAPPVINDDPDFGLLERYVDEPSILDTDEPVHTARKSAETRLDLLSAPVTYIESAQLRTNAPLSMCDIVPGAQIEVDMTDTCNPVTGTYRIRDLQVSAGEQESVSITLTPLGSTDTEEVEA